MRTRGARSKPMGESSRSSWTDLAASATLAPLSTRSPSTYPVPPSLAQAGTPPLGEHRATDASRPAGDGQVADQRPQLPATGLSSRPPYPDPPGSTQARSANPDLSLAFARHPRQPGTQPRLCATQATENQSPARNSEPMEAGAPGQAEEPYQHRRPNGSRRPY